MSSRACAGVHPGLLALRVLRGLPEPPVHLGARSAAALLGAAPRLHPARAASGTFLRVQGSGLNPLMPPAQDKVQQRLHCNMGHA